MGVGRPSTRAELRGNHIHHQRMGGLWVYKEAKGLYEDNEIWLNAKAGVRVWQLCDPTMLRNRIHSARRGGSYECGKGHFCENDIHDHREWNVEVKRYATPLFERNASTRTWVVSTATEAAASAPSHLTSRTANSR